MAVTFKGIIPPVSIMFDQQGKFDRESMGKVIDFLINSNVDGLFFLGSGGEFTQLTSNERKEIAEFVIQYVDNRLPVLIGTGSTNTREVIELSHHAFHQNADGVVVINPYYWGLSEENLYLHYHEIANAVEGPILLYNFPALTGQSIPPHVVLRLVKKHEHIVGIKETIDSTAHIRDMITTVKAENPDFSVLAGFDDHLFHTLALGGDGAISASVNFAAQISVDLYQAFQTGNYKTAIELHQKLTQIPTLYQLEIPFINVVKEATKMCGLDIPTYVQPPARMVSEKKREQIRNVLRQIGLIEKR
ncbi:MULTISPECIES: dihydrodipicolinate synthase family protein [Clostridia]|uniref:dihydrodipicolinate synthase family protein n=1 Tax=Clostridia TaxID=186801 RepID=UPI000EA0E94C|nr:MULTISPECIES: dihydrodipicolinate synthase family protein [Clostridia]NBJ71614.1 dihydrodipicolinate synthase family protein [Roseburia sp. 1XD42-34]RKI76847.1 dihydrodipicolinate synthase family protein [Clostridium sp. 1xD42-85]